MQTMYLTRGLPGSGKTTAARELATRQGPRKIRRVSRDDIRRMLGKYNDFTRAREEIVNAIEHSAVQAILTSGDSVIIDAMHLNPLYVKRWEIVAAEFPSPVAVDKTILDMTNIPLRECLKRNHQRPGDERVPNRLIHEEYAKWLAPQKRVINPNLPHAIILDVDGTAVHIGNRSPYDATNCASIDRLNEAVHAMVTGYLTANPGVDLIVVSGRDDIHYNETAKQLTQHRYPWQFLYMRAARDKRPDYVIKQEIFEKHIDGRYNIDFAIDDRDRIVDMWRSLGIPTMQVGEGWF